MSWINEVLTERTNATTKYVALASEVEFMAAQEQDSTGRTVKLRIIRPPEEQGKSNPFSRFTRKRRGKVGSRFEVSFAPLSGSKTLMLELMLLNWQSNPQGDSVVFLLNQETEQHPFMGCTRGSKDAPGTRWMVIAVEVDDTQELIEQGKQEQLEHTRQTGRQQHLSNAARIMTKNPTFWTFISEVEVPCDSAEQADNWLKLTIGIESKSELDEATPEAVSKVVAYHRVRERFVDWQGRNGPID